MMCDNPFTYVFDFTNTSVMENVVSKIKNFYQIDWFMNQTASWSTHYIPTFVETLTKRGFGSAFNMLPISEIIKKE
jgi:hypothetical protein